MKMTIDIAVRTDGEDTRCWTVYRDGDSGELLWQQWSGDPDCLQAQRLAHEYVLETLRHTDAGDE